MHNVIFLFFRRMRAPLLALICAYSVSMAGLVLIPGVDDQGRPWTFDFMHAFYFVSFMGSTIGFGEVPYDFTPAQRMWTTFIIYLTVISWLYAIGKILALVQDPAFKRALTEQRFTRSVRRLRSPFYLVCGYGETGHLLVRSLTRRYIQSVVIDINPTNISDLELEDLSFDIPSLCADAQEVNHLIAGGLKHPGCMGVVALTDNDDANVKIAVTSKLLRPTLPVICRAETQMAANNMASFKTDHIINPFNTFADHLAMALRTPSVLMLLGTLISVADQPLDAGVHPPRGFWIICGYGRFGRALRRYFDYEGLRTQVIEAQPGPVPEGAIIGRGTEAVTLREAGVDKAVGLIAGTDNDANNLSIVMTARELNPRLYQVARLTRRSNEALFAAAGMDLIMQGSRIIVWRILSLLTVPLLDRFLHHARHRSEEWAQELLGRIGCATGGMTPQTWCVEIGPEQAEAVHKALLQGRDLRLWHLLRDPQDRERTLPCVPLLLVREDEEKLLPGDDMALRPGDRLLFCARQGTASRMSWVLCHTNELEYVESGIERPDGYLWRWLERLRARYASDTGSSPEPRTTPRRGSQE